MGVYISLTVPVSNNTYYIQEIDFDMIENAFAPYGNESGFCIYDNYNNNLLIIPGETIYTNRNNIKFTCDIKYNNLNLLGRLHTHPDLHVECRLSPQDGYAFGKNSLNLTAIYCGLNRLNIYEFENGIMIKTNYEVI